MWYKKLVRDRIPEIIEKTGAIPRTRVLDTDEYRHELRWKLLEEVREATSATIPDELLAELADLQEIIDTLVREYGFVAADLKREQERKRAERGGFEKRLFLIGIKARP